MKTIVINPGHNENTKGKRSPFWSEVGIVEWEFNKYISTGLFNKLVNDDRFFAYIISQWHGEKLKQVVDDANIINPDMFISIHANAEKGCEKKWGNAHGVRTFICKKASGDSTLFCNTLGVNVSNAMQSNVPFYRIKNFYVLTKTKCPAVLLECGFMTNPCDATKMQNNYWRDRIVDAIYQSLVDFYYGN